MGDVIKLEIGEVAPADMVLLDSNIISERDTICYIDTKLVDSKS